LRQTTDLGACEKTAQYLCDTIPGVRIHKIELDYPVSNDEILRRTDAALRGNRNIRLVLMDAISSLPGVIFPWERLCEMCTRYGVYSLVDGAHAVTQIPIDISKSRPDFFVSNLHKWSYVARGCAVLYVRRDLQAQVHALPIGHGYVSTSQPFVKSPVQTSPEGQWVTEHEWSGTIDWSGYLAVDTAFQFIEQCGGAEKIREYCHALALNGGRRAAEIFGTEILECEGSELIANMVNVRLPLDVPDDDSELWIQRDKLFEGLFNKDCFPYPFVMSRGGKKEWWCRFSAQIYVDLDDFDKAARILQEICLQLPPEGPVRMITHGMHGTKSRLNSKPTIESKM
jgi:hercynylcysteine S-oxide lyase